MSRAEMKRPNPGERVILLALPSGFLDDLPPEDQQALTTAIGKNALLVGYDE
jgi:hypothetical protein